MNLPTGNPLQFIAWVALAVLAVWLAIKLLSGVFWLLGAMFRGIGRFFRHVFRFVGAMIGDSLRLVGSVLAGLAYLPACVGSTLLGRRSAAHHYGRALKDEIVRGLRCFYRLVLGNLLRLFALDAVTEGLEQRVPDVIARAPGPDRPSSGSGTFAGYRVTGSLQGGGSGARLYLAQPEPEKRRQLERLAAPGTPLPAQVVIKSFSLDEGSTLPQIVRENRALAAARDLGLVLEHELSATRFFYVMPYVPGDDLAQETARLHAAASAHGPGGLHAEGLARVMAFTEDLLATLKRFHEGGLWHKDVKPSNIIVSNGRVHLVDFGLITPLRSAMTLTTHGTEYFRDPEMVRLALKGVKVHEVDGIKFDIYGAGAVLYSLIENSFPAHGSLSRISRRCPEALRWVIRRAMADMGNRYASAAEMLQDLRAVSGATDPFAVKPADLPSLAGRPRVAEALAGASDRAGTPVGPETVETPPAGPTVARDPRADDVPPHEGSRGVPSRDRRWQPFSRRREARPVPRKLVAAGIIAALFFSGLFSGRGDSGSGAREVSRGRRAQETKGPVVSSVSEADRAAQATSTALAQARFSILEPVSLDRLPASGQAALSPPLPQPPLGVVLVLDDLPANADATRVAAVDGMCTRLRAARYALLGTAHAPDAAAGTDTTIDADVEITLLAGARSAAGLADPSDAEAVQRLTDFLAAQGDALDAILWIGRAEASDPVHARVITRSEALARVLSAVLGGRRAD